MSYRCFSLDPGVLDSSWVNHLEFRISEEQSALDRLKTSGRDERDALNDSDVRIWDRDR